MFAKARELLWRQRVIHPFPVDREEVICALLPPQMQDFIVGGDPEDTENIQWENLTQCVSLSMSNIIEIDGETGKAFWFGWTGGHPSPVHPDKAFSMYASHPHYDEIVAWWHPAMETHKKLMGFEQCLHDFFARASHPRLVKKYWPELLKFVDFDVPEHQKLEAREYTKRRIVPMPTAEDAAGIIETLAGSTLLDSYECNAWVDYETEDW
jgi:hypothetical protein